MGVIVELAQESEGPAAQLSLTEDDEEESLRLQQNVEAEDYYIDWVKKGKVTAVKNQGNCGSCWAFAAATVQETMQSIKTGKRPLRLSEQQGLDCCEESFGCEGGWMAHYWE